MDPETTLEAVTSIVASTLGIEDRAKSFRADTPLLGSVPELDSLAIVEIANALEERFGFTIDESDFTADVFETFGTLAAFVDAAVATDGS